GITNVYGVFNAPTYIGTQYVIENGARELFHNHSGSGTTAIYNVYIRLESVGTITIVVTDKSTQYTNRITEILTQDIVTGVSSGTTIPIQCNYVYGGFMQNTLQVNPTDRTKSSYNNGIRIGNFNNESALYLACSNTAINTVQAGQWEISKTSDNALIINPSSLRKADHSVGLSINGDSSKITSNVQNYVLNAGSSDSFAGVKCGAIQINPTVNNYNEGIRISRSTISEYSGIYLGCDPNSSTGTISGQWSIVNTYDGDFRIGVGDQLNQSNQGLQISADGQTLTFNGRVL
ncbi:MAG: hypothetical protein EZS28_046433, partial [Streblomastix strix]